MKWECFRKKITSKPYIACWRSLLGAIFGPLAPRAEDPFAIEVVFRIEVVELMPYICKQDFNSFISASMSSNTATLIFRSWAKMRLRFWCKFTGKMMFKWNGQKKKNGRFKCDRECYSLIERFIFIHAGGCFLRFVYFCRSITITLERIPRFFFKWKTKNVVMNNFWF